MLTITPTLGPWSRLSRDEWPTLLIGNGFSINLWERFSYKSLYDQAFFTPPADTLFAELDTTNFERVLECIHHASLTETALGRSTDRTEDLYNEVRDTLFEEVSDSHVPWVDIPRSVFQTVADNLQRYDNIFTTNYDLTLYWSLLQGLGTEDWVDLFWNPGKVFDSRNVELFRDVPVLYYLHGALHLWQNSSGVCGKWTSARARLLDVIQNYQVGDTRQPMFVSEGTSDRKLASIRRSEYLTFCLNQLEDDNNDTVIFGHGLGQEDRHIIEALNRGRSRRIAVAVYPGARPKDLVAEKGRIQAALRRHRILFFSSTTHPLGDPHLRVTTA